MKYFQLFPANATLPVWNMLGWMKRKNGLWTEFKRKNNVVYFLSLYGYANFEGKTLDIYRNLITGMKQKIFEWKQDRII